MFIIFAGLSETELPVLASSISVFLLVNRQQDIRSYNHSTRILVSISCMNDELFLCISKHQTRAYTLAKFYASLLFLVAIKYLSFSISYLLCKLAWLSCVISGYIYLLFCFQIWCAVVFIFSKKFQRLPHLMTFVLTLAMVSYNFVCVLLFSDKIQKFQLNNFSHYN